MKYEIIISSEFDRIRILNEDSALVATLKEFEISFQIEGC
jgi:hypothetical protein